MHPNPVSGQYDWRASGDYSRRRKHYEGKVIWYTVTIFRWRFSKTKGKLVPGRILKKWRTYAGVDKFERLKDRAAQMCRAANARAGIVPNDY